MKGLHIAFFGFPHWPHINPTFPIVATLVRRGHRITYVTSDKFAARVRALGAEVVRCPAVSNGGTLEDWVCGLAERTLKELNGFYDRNVPDAIIYDFVALAGRILAAKKNIPAIQVSPHFAFDRMNLDRQIGVATLRDRIVARSPRADEFLRAHGVASDDFLFHRERLNIYLFPREFEPSREARADERCLFAGRCAGEQPYFGTWTRPDLKGKRLALVATSSTAPRSPDYYRMCMRALSDPGWHVVLSVIDDPTGALLGPLPPNVEIIRGVSYTQIYPYASVVVYAGGTTSSAEAAYHGVPLIIASSGIEEWEGLGDNLSNLGLGVHLREEEMTVETLHRAMRHVTSDPAILGNVKRLQASVRSSPGGEETASIIEEYIDAHRGVAREERQVDRAAR